MKKDKPIVAEHFGNKLHQHPNLAIPNIATVTFEFVFQNVFQKIMRNTVAKRSLLLSTADMLVNTARRGSF